LVIFELRNAIASNSDHLIGTQSFVLRSGNLLKHDFPAQELFCIPTGS
jgi:hypothetical protein